jgi:hypothetical protein
LMRSSRSSSFSTRVMLTNTHPDFKMFGEAETTYRPMQDALNPGRRTDPSRWTKLTNECPMDLYTVG